MRKLLMIVILLGSPAVHANDRIDNYFSRYQIDISFSFHELGFEVKDQNNKVLGTLAGGMLPTFLVNFEVPGRFFGDSGFAYSLTGGLSTYCVNTQKLADNTVVNLNTSASGMSAYLTPSIFYSFGDRGFRENDYRAFKVGIGMGVGYLSATGGLVLTEEVGQPTHNLDISGFGVSNSAFIEYHRDRWIYRLRGMGPSFSDGNNRYSVYDVWLGVGYMIDM